MNKTIISKFLVLLFMVFASIVLVACGEKSFTVTFETNGGSTIASQTVVEGGKVIKPNPAPTKEGFVFVGYFKDEDFKTSWSFAADSIVTDTTIYVKWEPKKLEPLDPFWDADQNGIADWQEEEITLTYASWQTTEEEAVTIETVMLDAFMQKYPNITVEIQIVGYDSEWDTNMLALLETEDIPDVFLVQRLENFLPYGILADISDYYDHDPDTEYIFDSVKNLGIYGDKRFVVPTYIYPKVWVVNLDLLEAANIEAPKYDWTWAQMEAIAKAVYNQTTHVYGVYGATAYTYEYPKVLKMNSDPSVAKNWLARAFDGNKFNYDDDAYLQAMNALTNAVDEGWLTDNYLLTSDTVYDYYGNAELDPRYAGYVGMWAQPVWELKNYMSDFQFEWDAYPAPSGINGGNTDIIGVSSFCTHKAAAYQLLKWMSYGEDGILSRYDLYDRYKDELYMSGNNYPYPVADYGINGQGINEIWSSIPYGSTAKGFTSSAFIEALRNGAFAANKEVVGWDASDTAIGPYFSAFLYERSTDYATVREAIQTASDTALQLARQSIENN